ncbi:PIN domain-containing protein [Peribacillus sp. RS7]|uniref:PIN domain-containing protein n=1 Tax=Peribacillus sp. RS7 TaxID=3242679 RepID=UPI0035BF9248
MKIFLDSNPIYRDPFLTKGYNQILNKLARHEEVKLYISKVVYKEVLRGHKDFLEEELKAASNALKRVSPYLDAGEQVFIVDAKLEDFLQDFKNRYNNFQLDNKMEIIDYDADVLEHIVEMDMFEKNPFIKKMEITNKNEEIVRVNKKEVRDAIIWYSYQEFIEKNKFEDCYFISNNTKEFGDTGANNSPKNVPYPLHPELAKSNNIIAYKHVQDFLAHNDSKIKELFTDIHTQILTEDLSENIEEELEDGLAQELVLKYFTDQIFSETRDFLSEKQPDDLHSDYFMGGYVDPSLDGEISYIELKEFEIYGDEITVSVIADVEVPVDIYLYNPVYDSKDEKFQLYSTDTIKVEENLVFVIPIDSEKEIDDKNFSLRLYIEGIDPSNLNVDFLQWENIDHTDMFPDDYYDEDYYL